MNAVVLILMVTVANTVAAPANLKAVNWEQLLVEVNSIKTVATVTAEEVVTLITETHSGIGQNVLALLEAAKELARPDFETILEGVEGQTLTHDVAEHHLLNLNTILLNANTGVLAEMELLHPILIEEVNQKLLFLHNSFLEHQTNILELLSQ